MRQARLSGTSTSEMQQTCYRPSGRILYTGFAKGTVQRHQFVVSQTRHHPIKMQKSLYQRYHQIVGVAAPCRGRRGPSTAVPLLDTCNGRARRPVSALCAGTDGLEKPLTVASALAAGRQQAACSLLLPPLLLLLQWARTAKQRLGHEDKNIYIYKHTYIQT